MKFTSLQAHSKNVTSQFGEDGIISEIFGRIGTHNQYCAEIGAWDGQYLSNTWDLWHNKGWRALLIEGDAQRCHALKETLKGFPNVESVNSFVSPEGENSLDQILARSKAPEDIDLVSIDIDGDEYYVWKHLTRYRPRLVVVEYNPTIPPELDLVQLPGAYLGASASALLRLAHEKAYRLACLTETNCIFVTDTDFDTLGLEELSLESAFPRANLTYVINAYDGATYISKKPTYSASISVLGITVLANELKQALRPSFVQGRRKDLPEGAIVPVKIFGLPNNEAPRSLSKRSLSWALRKISETRAAQYWNNSWLMKTLVKPRANKKIIKQWMIAGSPLPPPHALKQVVLRKYAARYGIRILIETGTFLGDMVEAMRHDFDAVVSIELSPELSRRAKDRFIADSRVSILHGDSTTVLPDVLKALEEPALFWLDGHYSEGITARGEKSTPILSEVKSILDHQMKGHVVLVDDARCFNGADDYPTLSELEIFVRKKQPTASFEVQDDIIRILY